MVAVVEPARARGGARGLRALGAPLHRDRRGDRRRRAARRSRGGELVGAIPADAAHRGDAALRARARRAAGARPRPPATPANDAAEDLGLRAVRPARRLAHGAPARARRRRAPARRHARPRRLPRRPAARRARPLPRPAGARSWARRSTSPAPAASRSRSPTASTSATRSGPRSPGSSRRAIDGIAAAANELGIPVVSGNVSLYNETGGRPIPPTPVVGCVGLVADVTRIPVALAPRRPRPAPPRRGRRARRASSGRTRSASRSPTTSPPAAPRSRCARRAPGAASTPSFACPDGPGVIVALAPADRAARLATS